MDKKVERIKYGTIMYWESEKGVLLLKKYKRENDPNSEELVFPGGKMETYERGMSNLDGRFDSVIRETEEEIGFNLKKANLRGIVLFDNSERVFKSWHNPKDFYVQIYTHLGKSGEIKPSNEGVPIWVPENRVRQALSREGDKVLYDWIKKGRFFTGVIKYLGRKLNKEETFVDFFN